MWAGGVIATGVIPNAPPQPRMNPRCFADLPWPRLPWDT